MLLDFIGDECVDGCDPGEETWFVLLAREDIKPEDVKPELSELEARRGRRLWRSYHEGIIMPLLPVTGLAGLLNNSVFSKSIGCSYDVCMGAHALGMIHLTCSRPGSTLICFAYRSMPAPLSPKPCR